MLALAQGLQPELVQEVRLLAEQGERVPEGQLQRLEQEQAQALGLQPELVQEERLLVQPLALVRQVPHRQPVRPVGKYSPVRQAVRQGQQSAPLLQVRLALMLVLARSRVVPIPEKAPDKCSALKLALILSMFPVKPVRQMMIRSPML